jgi:hypothetical protein
MPLIGPPSPTGCAGHPPQLPVTPVPGLRRRQVWVAERPRLALRARDLAVQHVRISVPRLDLQGRLEGQHVLQVGVQRGRHPAAGHLGHKGQLPHRPDGGPVQGVCVCVCVCAVHTDVVPRPVAGPACVLALFGFDACWHLRSCAWACAPASRLPSSSLPAVLTPRPCPWPTLTGHAQLLPEGYGGPLPRQRAHLQHPLLQRVLHRGRHLRERQVLLQPAVHGARVCQEAHAQRQLHDLCARG